MSWVNNPSNRREINYLTILDVLRIQGAVVFVNRIFRVVRMACRFCWARSNVLSTVVRLAQYSTFSQSSAVSRWIRVVRHHEPKQCLLLLSVFVRSLWTVQPLPCVLCQDHH